MRMYLSLFLFVGLTLTALGTPPPDRPNILWLTFEDTSAYQFGCYGNAQVRTPTIDALATQGIRFDRASSVAPHCSPARSTIISGCFATTWGTDLHRAQFPVPDARFYFPALLREAGYFTANNSKTDYNAAGLRQVINRVWDAQGDNASYLNKTRKTNQPFFAVFNANLTHMGRIRSHHLEGRRDFAAAGLNPAELKLPPYVPDTPETRSDYAFHLEGCQDVDRWVKAHLDALEKHGLHNDTIVFVYSDHGGCLPRGKGYAYETGLRPVFIISIPERWRHLSAVPSGQPSSRLVGFEDLAPTILTLAGIKPPTHFHGVNILGPTAKPFQFGFRSNHGGNFDPIRTASNGRFKYIRNYIPHRPLGLWQDYQWGCPGHLAWYQQAAAGKLPPPWASFLEPKPFEELYDLNTDPWEMHNLAGRPEFVAPLTELREALNAHLTRTRDLGFFPPSARRPQRNQPLIEYVAGQDYPLGDLQTLAHQAAQGSLIHAAFFLRELKNPRPEFRFWAAAGLATLARAQSKNLTNTIPALRAALSDANPHVAAEIACALTYLGDTETAARWFLSTVPRESGESNSAASAFETVVPLLIGHRELLAPLHSHHPAEPAFLRAGWKSFDDYSARPQRRSAGLSVNQDLRPLHPLP
jgi:N-sulfoglucosamine sulfohydrolase